MLLARSNMSFLPGNSGPAVDSGMDDIDWQWDSDDDQKDSRLTEYTAHHKQTHQGTPMELHPPEASVPRFSRLRGSLGLKRPYNMIETKAPQDITKRRKIDTTPAPQRSSVSLLSESADAKPRMPLRTSTALARPASYRTTNGPFVEVESDDSDDEAASPPAPAPTSPPKHLFYGSSRILESNADKTLAESAAWREKAQRKKQAAQKEALKDNSGRRKTPEHRFASNNTLIDHGEPSRLRPTETLGPRLQSLPGAKARSSSKPLAQDVITIDSDSESSPQPRRSKTRNPTKSSTRHKSSARHKNSEQHSRSDAPTTGQAELASRSDRLQRFKKERSFVASSTPQSTIQPSIEIPDVAASIEKADDRRKRIDAEELKNFEERMALELERGRAEQQRKERQREADAALRHQREEEARAKREQASKSRQAAVELQRQKEVERQRKKEIDDKLHKELAEQLRRTREDNIKKKADADAKRQKEKAEEERRRDAERTRSIEQKKAKLAKRSSILDEEAQKKRDERIRQKRERAARNRQAEQEDDNADELIVEEAPKPKYKSVTATARGLELSSKLAAEQDDVNTDTYAPTPTLASKPLALNSAAGVKAVESASKHSGPNSARTGHARVLGEILDEDAKLVQWKDTGDQWPAIVAKYENVTGIKRSGETLRKRYRQVSDALSEADVGLMLKQRMFRGDEDARREVNRLIHRQWPLPAKHALSKDTAKGPNGNLTRRQIPQDSLPAPGEILPIDALLVRWRRDGMFWSNVIKNYEITVGLRKREDALRARFNEVDRSLEDANVFDDEIEALSNDAPGARAKVNGKVWQVWPPVIKPQQTQRAERPEARPWGRPPKFGPFRSGSGPQRLEPLPRPAVTIQTLPQTNEDSDTEDFSPQPRPSISGKTINNQVFRDWMQPRDDDAVEVDDSSSTLISTDDHESDIDEKDPGDCYYFVWRVYRRELTAEDVEAEVDIEEIGWQECGTTYEDLDEANDAAEQETKLVLPGGLDFRDVELSTDKVIHQDCSQFTVSSAEVGTLQVKVDVCVRLPNDRILPKTKKGWIGANIYYVTTRTTTTTTKKSDENPSETITDRYIREGPITGTFTSHLHHANSRSANIFAERMLAKTVDLRLNRIEKMRKVEELLQSMQWDEKIGGEKFYGKHETPEKGKVFEVWTEVARLAGPRNHFQFSKASEKDKERGW
ncbi:hypothetical protein CKM354_000817200 [Cercospora kikuchii]|uniref:Uncharacterized protein n=1 Tax=Cercospora kikuchii TaxID=84275 RepID=A0A9P3FF10_9PEZI|nr:uncharacterized protein CKM354_000817200 [Cercospora kikuchii]GIZ44988.1 hypothetical protein CKM354_000817200 [Cercospora kikuchii]